MEEPFKVKLERLPLGLWAYLPVLDSMPIPIRLTSVPLTMPSSPQSVEPDLGQCILAFTPTKLGKYGKYYI
jgi:hypothetical protein